MGGYSLVRAKGAAVPDVFESGGVRENKLSLPPGRPVDKAVVWWESFPMHGSGMRGASSRERIHKFCWQEAGFLPGEVQPLGIIVLCHK